MTGVPRTSWRAWLLEIHTSDPQVERRGCALSTIYLACIGVTFSYMPYILAMPLYEGRRLPYILILAGIVAFLGLNIWLSKRGKIDTSIVLMGALLVTAPTLLYLGLKIIMTMMWLVAMMPLLCLFAVRRKQVVMLAALATGSAVLARFYLAPYVTPTEVLTRETLIVFVVATSLAMAAYHAASGYRLVHDALVKNRREAEVATEKALQHAQQIEQKHALVRRANKEKSEFLASMSHELRTPLNAILGYSELLLEDLEEVETLPEELLEDTRCIQVASRHLLSLLHEMLDLEQIGEAPVMMAPTRFDLIDFCEEVLASMQVMARNHGNSLSLETMLEVREVYHDPTWMRQILFNLLSNAIKFTEDGIISVAVRNTHEEDADGEEKVLIEVRDTGVGMNEQELERVFEAFTQATDHTDREFGGTGLGLALCLDLTRKMKGDLQLASEPGEGTTVTISLPRTVEERA